MKKLLALIGGCTVFYFIQRTARRHGDNIRLGRT
jgi:hypothetical protein